MRKLFREKKARQITLKASTTVSSRPMPKGARLSESRSPEALHGLGLEDRQVAHRRDLPRVPLELAEPLENPLAVAILPYAFEQIGQADVAHVSATAMRIYVESTASPILRGSGAVSGACSYSTT